MEETRSKEDVRACLLLLCVTLSLTFLLMLYLPRMVSEEEDGLFVHVDYKYDSTTRFDNSYLTWATDYGLAVVTGGMALYIMTSCGKSCLRDRCVLLLTCYAVSVTTGGICHQYFHPHADLNTGLFRLLWTICVGFVTMAGAYIGSIGSNICKLVKLRDQQLIRFNMFILPEWFWVLWGTSLTAYVILGGLSMKRPACDIFVAGATQTFPSTYVFLVLVSNTWTTQHKSGRKEVTAGQILMIVGFYFNAPLFFLYPLLNSWGLNLGVINAFLHSWLCISWSMQAIGMRYFCLHYPRSYAHIEIKDEKIK